MKILRAADRLLTALVWALLILTFSLMLGLAATQVILREFFHTGILWGDVAARHLVIWVGFFGAYLATRSDKHFHIDVLTRYLRPRARVWFAAFSDFFAAVICYFLIRASWTFVTVGMDPDATLFLHIPQSSVAMIVPCGFGLMMLQFLLRTAENVHRALTGRLEEPA